MRLLTRFKIRIPLLNRWFKKHVNICTTVNNLFSLKHVCILQQINTEDLRFCSGGRLEALQYVEILQNDLTLHSGLLNLLCFG